MWFSTEIRKIIRLFRGKWQQWCPLYPPQDFGHIGSHCKIGADSALVPCNIFMDDYSIIQDRNNFISYDGKLVLGKYSVISSGCIIVPGSHLPVVGVPFYLSTMSHIGDESNIIEIAEDVWVGAGCVLLPKCRIGRGAIVGAGSVVTKEIPPYAVAVGNPARVVAAKLSKEDVFAHEKQLYRAEERMTEDAVNRLFAEELAHLPVMKKAELDDDDRQQLTHSLHEYGLDSLWA